MRNKILRELASNTGSLPLLQFLIWQYLEAYNGHFILNMQISRSTVMVSTVGHMQPIFPPLQTRMKTQILNKFCAFCTCAQALTDPISKTNSLIQFNATIWSEIPINDIAG